MSCGRARTHDHRISSQRPTLSRPTGRQVCTAFCITSSCNDYTITIIATDMKNAIAHLKSGKSNGPEDLFSVHSIHGTHRFSVLLLLL